MTPRERVTRALRKEPTDRVPIFMWFHPETADMLSELLEIPADAVGDAMGNDVHQTWVNNNYAMEGIVHEREGDSHTDAWGITWERRHGFNQIRTYPLKGMDREQVLAYGFPYGDLETLMEPMARVAERSEEYFLGCDVSPCAFEMYWRLREMGETLLDFALDPDLSKTMIRRCIEFALLLSGEAFSRFRLDWLWTGDDVASQDALLFGPETWREYIKPELKRLFDLAHAQNVFSAYHCCGALRPIIRDLAEIGLDVLNPVQPNCPGMNPADLKKEFGEKLSFMGGVDTQELLPNGTVRDVEAATSRLIETMCSDGGGFILAASHTIPPETPIENIFAMYAQAGLSREEIFDKAADLRAKGNICP